ncbi:MAG: transcriptional regulator, LysR family [Firmicutes bacterium]|nr:transcriptional regulator, LysR family [Bacillota bacterium]
MRLNQFEFLVALKRYKSFSKVSKALLISQPSISRAIKELEEELGYIVLKRGQNGIEFTPKGEMLVEKAENIMGEVYSIRDINSVIESDLKCEVRIGTSSHFCNAVVLDVLVGLKAEYPKLVIKLINSDVRRVIEEIAAKDLDVGIIQINTVDESQISTEIEKNTLTFTEIFNEEMCFIVGQNHPLLKKEKVSMVEILQFPFVTAKNSTIELLANFFQNYGYDKGFIQINDIANLRRFIGASNSVAVISRSAALKSNTIFKDNLVSLSISDFEWRCRTGWIHKRNALSSTEGIIIKELTDRCRQYNQK